MALIKSTILSAISGSVNGITFAKNKGGAYMRNRSMPLNPQSAKQSAVRVAFSNIAQAWRELTETQRTSWRAAAPNFPYTNKVGDERIYTGEQLFIKLNRGRQVMGLAQLDTAPTPVSVDLPLFDEFQASWDPMNPGSGNLAIQFLATIPTGVTGLVSIAPIVSPGINKLQKGRYLRVPSTISSSILEVNESDAPGIINPVTGEKQLAYFQFGIEATGQILTPEFGSFVWTEI